MGGPRILLAAVTIACIGCDGRLAINSNQTEMTLVSNKENTTFFVRPVDGTWQKVGVGKVAKASVPSGQPCEVRATTPGYVEKSLTVADPMGKAVVQMVWLEGERLGRMVLSVKAVSVLNGEVAPIVTDTCADSAGLRDGIRRCADALAKDGRISGCRIAVLRFAAAESLRGQAATARDILSERLKETAQVRIMERDELSKLQNEADLRLAGLVGTSQQRGRLADSVDYIVTGTLGASD